MQWVKEVFLKLQYAWIERDLHTIRLFESKELYARHEQQIKEYKQSGRINMKEHIDIHNVHLFMFKKDKESETLSVALNVRMADYIIDEYTHTVLNGKADKDYCFNYLYIFKRQTYGNMVAKQQIVICPNCGAPNSLSGSDKCEYCNFKITSTDSGWVLSDIMDIKQPDDCGRGGVLIESMGEK